MIEIPMENGNGLIYCRVSSLEQVDGTSLESQERLCHEFAKREGINILATFIDKGESAKTADRTEFLKAIAFCASKKNQIKHFIVYKVDRFARNQADHIGVRTKLKSYGTNLRSVTEPIDNSPMGKMMEGVLSTFAEFDNNVRTERSVNGMKEQLRKGIWVWPAPLGYTREEKGGVLIPDHNADYIRLAFKEYAKGTYTYKSLAKHLYTAGFRSPAGKPIAFQTIQKLIHNPLYAGTIRKAEWGIEVIGQHEPLISKELFARCQTAGRKHKGTKKTEINPDFPLRRLAVCAWCSAPLTGSHSRGRSGNRYPYYHHHKQNCPCALSLPKSTFEDEFVSHLRKINPSLKYLQAFKAVCLDLYDQKQVEVKTNHQKLQDKRSRLEVKKATIFNNFEDGVYSKSDFLARKHEIEQQLYALEAVPTDLPPRQQFEHMIDYLVSLVTDTAGTWELLEKYPDKRLRFQNYIFRDVIPYTKKEGFGTTKLSPIYSMYQHYLEDESSLVTLRGIEPRLQE